MTAHVITFYNLSQCKLCILHVPDQRAMYMYLKTVMAKVAS